MGPLSHKRNLLFCTDVRYLVRELSDERKAPDFYQERSTHPALVSDAGNGLLRHR